jgi:hypothetical protein
VTTLTCESCGAEYSTRRFRAEPDELACPCGGRRSSFRNNGRSTRRPISPASEEQRAKVKNALSIVSAKGPCDPAHLWPRSKGGCDSADCVVPLLRTEHRAYDDGRLDLLPALVAGGFWVELGHIVVEHQISPTRLVEQLTGERYGATGPLIARVTELESALETVG